MDSGCYVKINNQSFITTIGMPEEQLDIHMLRVNVSRGIVGPIYKLELKKNTSVSDEFQSKFKIISVELDKIRKRKLRKLIYLLPSKRVMPFSILSYLDLHPSVRKLKKNRASGPNVRESIQKIRTSGPNVRKSK